MSEGASENLRDGLADDAGFALETLARQLDWNLLRSFIVIVEEQSITRRRTASWSASPASPTPCAVWKPSSACA